MIDNASSPAQRDRGSITTPGLRFCQRITALMWSVCSLQVSPFGLLPSADIVLFFPSFLLPPNCISTQTTGVSVSPDVSMRPPAVMFEYGASSGHMFASCTILPRISTVLGFRFSQSLICIRRHRMTRFARKRGSTRLRVFHIIVINSSYDTVLASDKLTFSNATTAEASLKKTSQRNMIGTASQILQYSHGLRRWYRSTPALCRNPREFIPWPTLRTAFRELKFFDGGEQLILY